MILWTSWVSTYGSGWWECDDLWNAARLTRHHFQHLGRHLRRRCSTRGCRRTLSCRLRHRQPNCGHRGSSSTGRQPSRWQTSQQCGTCDTGCTHMSCRPPTSVSFTTRQSSLCLQCYCFNTADRVCKIYHLSNLKGFLRDLWAPLIIHKNL